MQCPAWGTALLCRQRQRNARLAFLVAGFHRDGAILGFRQQLGRVGAEARAALFSGGGKFLEEGFANRSG
jgi:hypothetical protein